MIECHPRGRQLATPHADGLYYEDDELTCACGAVSRIGVDDDQAYVSGWRCRHGVDEEDPCEACDHEDEPAEPAEGPMT